jgi:hypothetical protein
MSLFLPPHILLNCQLPLAIRVPTQTTSRAWLDPRTPSENDG